jgi:hypothetical protein
MLLFMLTAYQTKLDLRAPWTPDKSAAGITYRQVAFFAAQRAVLEDQSTRHAMK